MLSSGNKGRGGFTLIEAIMVMMIIGILATVGGFVLVYVVRNSVFIPQQLNSDMLASDALDIMIEGDGQARGLRFSRNITALSDNQVTFTNQDNQSILYRWDNTTNKLYRSIAGGPENLIPTYAASGIDISAKSNKLFTYYDASEAVTSTPANVRRINMTVIAQTGTGSFADWQGWSEQSSSIAVNKFQ